MDCKREELLIATVARLLEGCRNIAVGVSSPIPGSAALLSKALSDTPVHVDVLESLEGNSFTRGSVELFDRAAQGRVDAFFLGGGQIDGEANINLVGVGDYPTTDVRWPGSFGSAYLYFVVPRVILFREEHSRRVLVPKVDFISAPGVSAPEVYRRGGPHALVTNMALFSPSTRASGAVPTRNRPSRPQSGGCGQDNTGFDVRSRRRRRPRHRFPIAAVLDVIRGPVARRNRPHLSEIRRPGVR